MVSSGAIRQLGVLRWGDRVIEFYGGPVQTRTADLYRVTAKQPLQDQQEWLQVVDSVFDGMGQKGPIVPAMGQKGPNFSAAFPSIPSALGKCIRHARQDLGCTVEALATASGLPAEYIEAVETG